jgi:hypothetical protein
MLLVFSVIIVLLVLATFGIVVFLVLWSFSVVFLVFGVLLVLW